MHRIGRTARVGHTGEALLLLLPSEAAYLQLLADRGLAPAETPLAHLLAALPGGGAEASARPGVHPAAFALLRRMRATVAADAGVRSAARAAFASCIRAYAAHPASVKAVFHVKKLHLGHVAASFGI